MKKAQIDYFSEKIKKYNNSKFLGLKKSNYRAFGLPTDNVKIVNSLNDLRNQPPNIVITEALKNVDYIQNNFKKQSFKKKQKYIMNLGMFESLQYDPNRFYRKNGKNLKLLKPASVQFHKMYRPYKGQELHNKTLLIWRTGGIGDLLFIKPNLDYLKEIYPTCTIKFACGPQYQSMVGEWDCVDMLLDLPFTFNHLVNADYHCIFEGVIERTIEAHTTNAYILFSRWMGLDLPKEKLRPKQTPDKEKVKYCKNVLHKWFLDEKNFVLIQVRASSPVRTPNPSFWFQLIDKLTESGEKIILIDMPDQENNLINIKEKCKNSDDIFVFAKESLDVSYMIALASLAKVTISTDSSLIHIAESVGTKNFGIYGPFPGRIRLETYQNSDWMDVKYPCAPCFIHNHKPCKNSILGYSPCFSTIDIDNCIEKIKGLTNV